MLYFFFFLRAVFHDAFLLSLSCYNTHEYFGKGYTQMGQSGFGVFFLFLGKGQGQKLSGFRICGICALLRDQSRKRKNKKVERNNFKQGGNIYTRLLSGDRLVEIRQLAIVDWAKSN